VALINEEVINILRDQGPVILLESQSTDHPSSNTSFLAGNPEVEIRAFGDDISIHNHVDGTIEKLKLNPWEALKYFRSAYPGWHFGYLSYDLKDYTTGFYPEFRPSPKLPDLYFFKPSFLVSEAHNSGSHIITDNKALIQKPTVFSNQHNKYPFKTGDLRSNVSKSDYLKCIREAKNMIYEGENYEINLSHQLSSTFSGDPYGLYLRMKNYGPVPFGVFMQTKDVSVCSASPERFLKKTADKLISEPIKGTSKRSLSAEEDTRLIKELESSVKDRAENLMIVDLVRNDLNRISRPGTVKVEELCKVYSFKTVHQMVSKISSGIREDISPVESIRSCFPMGSMTGAPKIRAMKLIEELEQSRRGLYSGAIGYFTPEGNFDFNVVIRTAIIFKGLLTYGIGGAITSDSEPENEWEETWIKAKALQNILNLRF